MSHPAVDPVVPRVRIGVDEPGVAREERLGVLLAPAGRQVEHGVRIGRVAEVDPSVGRPPRAEQRHRCLVGVDRV